MSGKLRINGSLTGYSELEAPANAGDQTFTFPEVGGVLATVGSGGGGGDGGSGADAWGNVDSAGVLQNGLNVTTSKVSTGIYNVVFDTPMPNNTYSVAATSENPNSTFIVSRGDSFATNFQIISRNTAGAVTDTSFNFAVFATNATPPKGTTGTDAWGSIGLSGNIKASYNIASVTKSTTGTYDVVFTTPMPTSNYGVVVSIEDGQTSFASTLSSKTVTGFTVNTNNGSALTDKPFSFTVNATNAQLPQTVTQEQIEAAINNPGLSAWGSVSADTGAGGVPQPPTNGLNIASVTRSGTGTYDILFQTPMPDANYSVTGSGSQLVYVNNPTTAGFQIVTTIDGGSATNADFTFQVAATNALPPKGTTGTDAWANVTASVSLEGSYNIASVTSVSTGIYNVVFTTPMPTNDYAVTLGTSNVVSVYVTPGSQTANGFQISLKTTDNATYSAAPSSFAVFASNAQLPDTVTQEQIDQALANRYQQGVWIPDLTFNYSNSYGLVWWRIGNTVTLQGAVGGFSNLQATDIVTVDGMPYSPSLEAGESCVGSCQSKNTALACTSTWMSSTGFRFYQSASGVGSLWEPVKFNQTAAGTMISWSLSYLTDDTTWVPQNGATVS